MQKQWMVDIVSITYICEILTQRIFTLAEPVLRRTALAAAYLLFIYSAPYLLRCASFLNVARSRSEHN